MSSYTDISDVGHTCLAQAVVKDDANQDIQSFVTWIGCFSRMPDVSKQSRPWHGNYFQH